MTTPRKLLSLTLGVVMAATSLAVLPDAPKASAACAAQPTTYGRSTATVNVPTAGTYRVWSRIKVPSTSANSYTLEVDGTVCGITVGDHTALPVNTWAWVDFQAGVTTSKTNVTLTAGSHTFVMIGREADVQLDRVILTADTACVPTGLGENCANPPDKTAPTTAITSPANNAVLTGTATTVSATAADDVAVSKVEFFMDNTLVTTDTTSPYSASINPSTMTAGNHTLYTKAYDTAATPNVGTSTVVNVTVRDAAAPTISAIASGSITQTGATITWTTSEASDTQV
ncbi:MAG TPA: Ig-like domain-containing protein, partial [Candidatus Saccharimonadales bacterium]